MALLPDLDDIPFLNPYYEERGRHGGDYETLDEEFIGEGGAIEYESTDEDGSGMSSEYGSGADIQPEKDKLQRDPMMEGWFPGREIAENDKAEFERLECRRHFLQAKPGRMDPMPKECERILYSISYLTFQVGINVKRITNTLIFVIPGCLG